MMVAVILSVVFLFGPKSPGSIEDQAIKADVFNDFKMVFGLQAF